MFFPVKAHNEFIDKYNKEPSIRIGRHVPKNAVNMAYYFNPTATDAEKVLCADAPRNTIDHRVEEEYKYLFDMPEQNNNLFPLTIDYEDESGYSGALSRIWARWNEKSHIYEKNMQHTQTIIVDNKKDVPTSHTYSDDDGFKGNLFLDAVTYEVKNTHTETINTTLFKNIESFELATSSITNDKLNYYMNKENGPWPKKLYVKENTIVDDVGNIWSANTFDGYTSPDHLPLVLTSIEKDPIASLASEESLPSFTEEFDYVILQSKGIDISNPFNVNYKTDVEINDFINLMENTSYYKEGKGSKMWNTLKKWSTDSDAEKAGYAIEISRASYDSYTVTAEGADYGKKFYLAGYKMTYSRSSSNETTSRRWNVYANYSGLLLKPSQETKSYPISWEATIKYTGIVRNVWYTYDGIACYRGSIVKADGVGNVNPELSPDILMYPDDNGYLRRYGIDGKEYYNVEAEQFYITDVFKDKIPCFYEYVLSKPIHDYRGPDDNGYYEGDAVKVYTSNFKDLPIDYKYQLKLKPAEYETTIEVINGEAKEIQKVKKYNAYLYTNFISTTTDNYKTTYNAFIEYNNHDDINTNNGISEEIYNRPFLFPNKHFSILPVNSDNEFDRINKIKITNPNIIEDNRFYVTFEYKVIAYRKLSDGIGTEKVFESNIRQAQILNKEYAVESEYSKFIDRGMIISPKVNGVYLSPFDIVISDQSLTPDIPPVVTVSNSEEFIFYCKPVQETLNTSLTGAININCNTDGSGVITAETTIDTGFYNKLTGTFTKKLIINNPYIVENGKIYPGYMVRCLDVRNISVKAPRESHLLESWYPLIQFGHYNQVMAQYGAYTKVAYTMPEYDTQHWGIDGKPYVDIIQERAEILNPHMIKIKKTPLYLPKEKHSDNITVIRWAEDESFVINVKNISFTEGIIITEEAISENDIVLVSYTYIEEHYVYRGFNRNELDFCRIDLNPNQYHTYSDLSKEPSELLPTINLFNRTIYFYLRPSSVYVGKEETTYNQIEEISQINLKNIYDNGNMLVFNGDEYSIGTPEEKTLRYVYDETNGTIKSLQNESVFTAFTATLETKNYDHTVKLSAADGDDDVIAVIIALSDTENLTLCVSGNTNQSHTKMPPNNLAVIYNYYNTDQQTIAYDSTLANVISQPWNSISGIFVRVKKEGSVIKIYRSDFNSNTLMTEPCLVIDLNTGLLSKFIESSTIGYGCVSQTSSMFTNIKVITVEDEATTNIVYELQTKNKETLYHTIDEYSPESEKDIYIGSVYIRQNTSLHSTILIDTRTRGGGVLEEMKDSLRKELEPESDFYLDIGYYDGIPYQENAVIIVRLDNSILKEYGGRFLQGDIEEKIKKWLGVGIYPIIEYVDSYSKYDMPQYNLIVEDSYTNVVDETPEINLECISI